MAVGVVAGAAVRRPVDRDRYFGDRAMPCRVAPDRAAGAILGHPQALGATFQFRVLILEGIIDNTL